MPRTAQAKPVGSMFDFIVMLLERGINFGEGDQVLTVTLGDGRAPAAEPPARRGRKPGRPPGRPAAKPAAEASEVAEAPAKKGRRGRKARKAAPAKAPGKRGRKPGAGSRKRGAPVSLDDIMGILKAAGEPLDRHKIAEKLNVSYHKLIRRMDALVKSGQVTETDQKFSIV